jgi:UDP-N-acetylmuramoyl-L-alanyl-D-glutamate--2,6-diaminopimelate ligase
MNLASILSNIKFISFIGSENIEVGHITYDSRCVKSNSIFVAIKGLVEDGNKYIKSAIERGASVIVCENIPGELKDMASFLKVENSRKAMAQIAALIYDKPSEKLQLVGVTGTNGKTSITYLLRAIFEYLKIKNGVIGTLGIMIDDEHIKAEHTTPESSEIQYLLNKMIEKSVGLCSMEVSSHSTELNRVDNLDFDTAIFTNLTRDHLDFHGTMENYYLAKKKLFYLTKNSNIINVDDEYGQRLYKELKSDNIKALSYAIENEADIKASNLITSIKGTEFDLKIGDLTKKVFVKTPGKFSVLNSMAALGAAYSLGIDIDASIKALKHFNGVIGRFEVIDTKLDCTIILDFAHTPDGLAKVMDTINGFATGRKIVMFGAGGDRDISRRAPMGEIAGQNCDLTILTSDNPRFENPYDICEEIAQGVIKYGGDYKIIVEREEAIYYAIKNHKKDDVILLAGKSTEPYQDIGIEKVPYDERTVTKNMIKKVEEELKI